MKKYIPLNLGFETGDIKSLVNNFQSISASILSVISSLEGIIRRVGVLEDEEIKTWTTATRPTKTDKTTYIGINTTTNKLEHTYDGGSTWYNADGTAA